MLPYPAKQKTRARLLCIGLTDAERKLWVRLRARQPCGVKFRRQHPVGPFITDFCALDARLVVELDGGQHAVQTDRDQKRTVFLRQSGYRILRFWDNEVLSDTEAVLERIGEALIESAQTSALLNGEK